MTEPSTSATADCVLQCEALSKSYPQANGRLDILNGVELAVARGETLAIVGPSGAGKTTLLHMLGGLDLPSSGCVRVNGQDISALDDRARSRLRLSLIHI